MGNFEVVEICAGAGGQALGLDMAGFEHVLAVELDENACNTLRSNRSNWKIAQGDVADASVWRPTDYEGVSLLAGGVPCPPFSIAGKQLGANDERDLFAWAVEQTAIVKPRALLLENVRGLAMSRFAGYRQHVLDRLTQLGYVAEWRLLQAANYGVPQLRSRFILVAIEADYAPYFHWPDPVGRSMTVGETLADLMGSGGWRGAESWAATASRIAPTGRKTARYRQIGNALPPPVAHCVGEAILRAFNRNGKYRNLESVDHDLLYKALRSVGGPISQSRLMRLVALTEQSELERRLGLLSLDFDVQVSDLGGEPAYLLGEFRGFIGQKNHSRYDAFLKYRAQIS